MARSSPAHQWKAWNGALVVACLDGSPDVGQRLLVMRLNAAGTGLVEGPITVFNRGARLRTAVQGTDGNLYVVTDGPGGTGVIVKMTPSCSRPSSPGVGSLTP